MRFATAVTFLAASVTAAPKAKSYPAMDQITVAQADDACGNNMQVTCCNDSSENGSGLLNGLTIFGQCNKLNVNVLVIANDLLNKQCSGNAACCQNSGSTATGGLINIAMPCIALSSLI